MALRRVGTLHGRLKTGLSVNVSETAAAAVLHCSGQICLGEEATLLSIAAQKYLNADQDIVLELSSVEAVDSAGIRELVLVHMQACAAERQVRIAAPSKELLDLLKATNVASLFEIHPTLDRALASLTSEVA